MNRVIFPVLILMLVASAFSAFAETEIDPDRTYEGGEVVVTASRYDDDTSMNVTNISQEELQLREPDLELPMLLQGIPGVFSFSDAGSGLGYTYLKIRGFDQRRVGVLFNGIPLNDPEDHQVWWVDMPDLAASVQDIQVQRGITNSIGGMTAIGGTVNIISANLSDTPGGMFSLNAGSYGFSKQMITYQTGRLGKGFKSMIRLSRQESDGYRDRSGYEGWGVFWSGQYETANTSTRINIYTGKELTHHAWDAVPASILATNRTANMETYHNAVDDFRQPHYELHNTVYFSDNLSLTNRLYYIKGEGFYENYKEDQRAADYALDTLPGVAPDDDIDLIRQKWVRKDHVGWVPGLEWQQDRGRLLVGGDWYTFHSDHWGDVMWAEGFTPADFNEQFKYHQYTGDKDAFSLYVTERYRIVGGLTATVDLHFQHKQYSFMQDEAGNFTGDLRNAYTVDYDFFNPKGSLHWQVPGRVVGGEMAAYGSVGRNHREPTDGELFDTWQSGSDLGVQPLFRTSRDVLKADGSVDYVEWFDPYVKEERVDDYEVGISWQNPHLSFTLGGYWMDFQNEIVALGGVSEDGSSIRGNAARTEHKGLELGLRAKVADAHDLSLAASRSWDEFGEFIFHDYDGSVHDYSGNPISLFPSHLLMVAWDANWTPGVRTRLRLRDTGRQHLDNTGNKDHTIDPWNTVDLSLWFDLAGLGARSLDGARVFVHLRNLGDTEYETWGYWAGENYFTPAAGRNFAVGMDYTF
jgi:iron complex outermembrane receptor protein